MGRRTGVMLCYPYEERRLTNPKFGWNFPTMPVIVQPKYDGERGRVVVKDGNVALFTSEAREVTFLNELKQQYATLPNGHYDGEFYVHGWEREEIHSVISRTKEQHKNDSLICHYIFDLINTETQIERISKLESFALQILPLKNIQLSPWFLCFDLPCIMKRFNLLVADGYEGIVVRHSTAKYETKRNTKVMKFKPKKRDVYSLINVIPELNAEGIPQPRAGKVKVMSYSSGDTFYIACGNLTHKEREYLAQNMEKFLDAEVVVSYQSSKGGTPLFGFCVRITSQDGTVLGKESQ